MEQTKKKLDTLFAMLADIKCDVCQGFGHYPSKCATKDRMDEMVKFIPDVREFWRQLKASKVDKEKLKKVVENKVKLSKKKAKKASLAATETAVCTQESKSLMEEGMSINESWNLGFS